MEERRKNKKTSKRNKKKTNESCSFTSARRVFGLPRRLCRLGSLTNRGKGRGTFQLPVEQPLNPIVMMRDSDVGPRGARKEGGKVNDEKR